MFKVLFGDCRQFDLTQINKALVNPVLTSMAQTRRNALPASGPSLRLASPYQSKEAIRLKSNAHSCPRCDENNIFPRPTNPQPEATKSFSRYYVRFSCSTTGSKKRGSRFLQSSFNNNGQQTDSQREIEKDDSWNVLFFIDGQRNQPIPSTHPIPATLLVYQYGLAIVLELAFLS